MRDGVPPNMTQEKASKKRFEQQATASNSSQQQAGESNRKLILRTPLNDIIQCYCQNELQDGTAIATAKQNYELQDDNTNCKMILQLLALPLT